MAHSEDHSALAAEYALGTLDAAERAEAEALIGSDAEFAALVTAWEYKLGALNQMVGLVEPRAEVWDRIKAAIAAESQRASLSPLAAPPASAAAAGALGAPGEPILPRPANDHGPAPVSESTELSPESKRVVYFAKRAYVWRGLAMLSSAAAVALLAVVGAQVYQPDALPDALRPPVRTKVVTVEAPPQPIPAQYVAVLQKDGDAPAFILTVDAGTKTFTVRRVAATPEPGKSYELWLVSDKLQKPRSLGVIGGRDFTVNPVLSSFDPELVNKATYAVTIEPEGGSPTGVATGPIVFTGKLVESVPPEPTRAAPPK
ncbi:anti-sigma factor [Rhodopseudomonas palustris]|uniref:Anti-sigma factor n=1 Tax=Rhodopseudomonas palustris TaxID=1076 RepID=A0A323UBK6_RHOPL|nr:anti-sigma factor [Rhodopseudomonas palustris]PZA10205.1 anti-sigma factor [Rhodopseudomonas palustris]